MSFDKDGFEVKGTKHRIHIACKNGDIKAVKEQLDAGVDPNIREKSESGKGPTPLHYTVCCKESVAADIIQLLFDSKADINAKMNDNLMENIIPASETS